MLALSIVEDLAEADARSDRSTSFVEKSRSWVGGCPTIQTADPDTLPSVAPLSICQGLSKNGGKVSSKVHVSCSLTVFEYFLDPSIEPDPISVVTDASIAFVDLLCVQLFPQQGMIMLGEIRVA